MHLRFTTDFKIYNYVQTIEGRKYMEQRDQLKISKL